MDTVWASTHGAVGDGLRLAAGQRGGDRVEDVGRRARADDQRVVAVLALRLEVERDPRGHGVLARDDDEVGGPVEAVDADLAGHLALGLLHVEVARADDDVDGGATVSVP